MTGQLKKYLLVKFLFFTCCFSVSGAGFAAETDLPAVKWLRIFIYADVNKVYFKNIWVFQRKISGSPRQVNIVLPADVTDVKPAEPNAVKFTADTCTVTAQMAADSTVGSVVFSYALKNSDGLCRTEIIPRYDIDSAVVYVSGPAADFGSNVLKYDKYISSKSVYSGAYTARNLKAAGRITINLKNLPRRDSRFPEVICIIGLGLIVAASLLTLILYSKDN